MFFHHHDASFCSNMLLTDSPEFTHLLEDQAPSVESLSAPSQSKMVCLKWIPISETVQIGTGSKVIHLFLHSHDNWVDIILVHHLLVEHPFAAGFGQTCKAWRSLADSLSNSKDPDGKLSWYMEFMALVKRQQKSNLKS
jgi:hypothetical protein